MDIGSVFGFGKKEPTIPYDKTCKSGFIPKTISSGVTVNGVTLQCKDDASDYVVGGAGGTAQTCPLGYVVSGYRGSSGFQVGSLAWECTPGTDEAKLKCCMEGGGGKCRAFQPQSGTCDAFMRSWALKNPNAPESACLNSRLPVPNCTDSLCNAYAYHPGGMPMQCPVQSLTYQDCRQLLSVKDGDSNDVRANTFAQSCQQLYSDLRTVSPPIPTPGQLPVPNTGGSGASIDSGVSSDVSNDGGGGGGSIISDRLSGINKPLLAVSVGGVCIMLLVGGAALLYLLSGDDSYDGVDDAFSSLSSVGSLSTSSIKL
jgi:hypothetical protein